MLLCFLPTILGCSQSVADKPLSTLAVAPANTQDLAPVRCPPADPRTVAEFKRTTAPPDGEVTKRGSQAWLDAYEESEKRKNRAGQRLVKEYEGCRRGGEGVWETTARALGTS